MSVPISRPDTYQTFNAWMADAHSLISRIQHEIDGVELGGGDSEFIRTEALGELIEMTEAFNHLLKVGEQKQFQDVADCYHLAGGDESLSPSDIELRQEFAESLHYFTEQADQAALAWLQSIETGRDEQGGVMLIPVWIA